MSKNVPNTVAIQGQEVAILEYHGQRVVTFAMIDQLHQRPSGTASRNFRKNKDRFVDGVDIYLLDSQGLDEFRRNGFFGDSAQRGLVLTESGYLMLVKSFTDDLAWAVQRELVNCYFQVKSGSAKKTQPDVPSLAKVRANFRALVGLHREYGLDKHQAMLAAERVLIREFGIEIGRYLDLPGKVEGQVHLALPSPVQERFYNPTEIGARLDPVQSAIRVNKLLLELGLQVDAIVGGHKTWALTNTGEEYGRYYDTGKSRHSGGAPIQQIRWRQKTVEVLQAALRSVVESGQ